MEEFLTLALPWELSFSRVHVPRIPSVYLALRANDKVRRFINIHLHYSTKSGEGWLDGGKEGETEGRQDGGRHKTLFLMKGSTP